MLTEQEAQDLMKKWVKMEFNWSLFDEESAIKLANLTEILKLGYPNLALSWYDTGIVMNHPAFKRNFYPLQKWLTPSKKGFIYSKTLIWQGYELETGECKIAFKPQESVELGSWSEVMTFKEEGDDIKNLQDCQV